MNYNDAKQIRDRLLEDEYGLAQILDLIGPHLGEAKFEEQLREYVAGLGADERSLTFFLQQLTKVATNVANEYEARIVADENENLEDGEEPSVEIKL